jgi:hypothetical protein
LQRQLMHMCRKTLTIRFRRQPCRAEPELKRYVTGLADIRHMV